MYFYLFRSADHRACHLKPIAFPLVAEIDEGANRHYFSAKTFQVMAVKFSISLTDEQQRFAKKLVEARRYSSVSAVLQQGFDLLSQRMHNDDQEGAAQKALLDQRSVGALVSGAPMDESIARMVAKKRRAHAVQN